MFTFFNLERMVKKPDSKKARGTVTFEGDSPQRAVSADGYDLVYHLPGAFRGRTLVSSLYVPLVRPGLIRYITLIRRISPQVPTNGRL